MQTTKAKTIPSAVLDRVVRGNAAANVLLVAAGSMLVALAAQVAINIPFTPVPLTLQPMAVLLVAVVLGSTRGAAAMALYLLEGASGLPVFAQGHGGIAWLIAAPTAGYLWSYPAAAWVAGWFSERGWGSTTLRSVAGMLSALVVIYLGGWSWLAVFSGPAAAFSMGIAPFFIADLVKIGIGATMLPWAQKFVTRG